MLLRIIKTNQGKKIEKAPKYNFMDLINKYGMNGLSYEEEKKKQISQLSQTGLLNNTTENILCSMLVLERKFLLQNIVLFRNFNPTYVNFIVFYYLCQAFFKSFFIIFEIIL